MRNRICLAASALSLFCCAGPSLVSRDTSSSKAPDGTAVSSDTLRTDGHNDDLITLHWFHDEYSAARKEAENQGKPLLIDMWANWCHTCLSMKHFVLNDKKLNEYASRFVWLSLDTDKEANAEALERFPVSTWPTFFVVDPKDQSVLTRYLGAASISQFAAFLEQGERVFSDPRQADKLGASEKLLNLMRQADQASLLQDWTRAARLYRSALGMAGPDWPRKPDLLVSLISALASSEQWPDCVQLGLANINDTGNSASAADFISFATSCAEHLDKNDKHKKDLLTMAEARLRALADDGAACLSVDDLSFALLVLRQVQIEQGYREGAIETAKKQIALLDKAATDALSPEAASTYNWPRAEAYVFLGRGRELIPILEESSRALPGNFDPPYRLAWVALQIGDQDRAYDAARQACRLAYGPRKGNALSLLADILKARGNRSEELKVRKEIVELYTSLAPGLYSQKKLDLARQALADMKK